VGTLSKARWRTSDMAEDVSRSVRPEDDDQARAFAQIEDDHDGLIRPLLGRTHSQQGDSNLLVSREERPTNSGKELENQSN
jgi:hypothetical protein